MKKIAILTCLASNDVCARVSCMNAFHNRTGSFQEYDGDTQLAAIMTCNGCKEIEPAEPAQTPGLLEKIQRLKDEQVSAVHVGVCVNHHGKQCSRIATIRQMLETEGIKTVTGTH